MPEALIDLAEPDDVHECDLDATAGAERLPELRVKGVTIRELRQRVDGHESLNALLVVAQTVYRPGDGQRDGRDQSSRGHRLQRDLALAAVHPGVGNDR